MRKYKIFIILIILFTINTSIMAQWHEPSAEIKAYVLSMLHSPDYFDRSKAVGEITLDYNIPEAVPFLEQTIWQQDRYLTYEYLLALSKYNSVNFVQYAHQFINQVDTMHIDGFSFLDPLEMKVHITLKLFKKEDFTTANYVFELIDREKPKIFINESHYLDYIINNLPSYEEQAKQELIRLAYEDDWDEGANAILTLIEKYGQEAAPILANAFVTNTYRPTKAISLENLLKYNYPNLDQLMRERLVVDSEMTAETAESLLDYYPTTDNYRYVMDHLNQMNSRNRTSVIYTLIAFESDHPDTSKTIIDLLNDLINFTDTCYNSNWLGELSFKEELQNKLQSAKNNLQNGDSLSCRIEVKLFQDTLDYIFRDSLYTPNHFVTTEGWQFLYAKSSFILKKLPKPQQNPNLLVNLQNSQGVQIPASNVKYYDTSWKDAVDNGDGTFIVITTQSNVSVRVFYEYANQTVNNVPAQNNTFTFHTVNTQVELENSTGQLIDEGTVKYYAGAWRDFGITVNGIATKELLPVNYSFRMTYEYGSNDKQQDISSNPTVIFQTVNAQVQLQNSTGNLIDEGTVQYYAGAWRDFGTTVNGVVHKELLPNNYSFRMTYEYVSKDKQQDLNTNPIVTFSTVLCTVQVRDQNNQPLNNGDVKYYSGAWREIGLTVNGEITKELLPVNLTFRAALGTVQQDVQQDLSVNNVVQIVLNIQ